MKKQLNRGDSGVSFGTHTFLSRPDFSRQDSAFEDWAEESTSLPGSPEKKMLKTYSSPPNDGSVTEQPHLDLVKCLAEKFGRESEFSKKLRRLLERFHQILDLDVKEVVTSVFKRSAGSKLRELRLNQLKTLGEALNKGMIRVRDFDQRPVDLFHDKFIRDAVTKILADESQSQFGDTPEWGGDYNNLIDGVRTLLELERFVDMPYKSHDEVYAAQIKMLRGVINRVTDGSDVSLDVEFPSMSISSNSVSDNAMSISTSDDGLPASDEFISPVSVDVSDYQARIAELEAELERRDSVIDECTYGIAFTMTDVDDERRQLQKQIDELQSSRNVVVAASIRKDRELDAKTQEIRLLQDRVRELQSAPRSGAQTQQRRQTIQDPAQDALMRLQIASKEKEAMLLAEIERLKTVNTKTIETERLKKAEAKTKQLEKQLEEQLKKVSALRQELTLVNGLTHSGIKKALREKGRQFSDVKEQLELYQQQEAERKAKSESHSSSSQSSEKPKGARRKLVYGFDEADEESSSDIDEEALQRSIESYSSSGRRKTFVETTGSTSPSSPSKVNGEIVISGIDF